MILKHKIWNNDTNNQKQTHNHKKKEKDNHSQVCQHNEILYVPCEVELYECVCVSERLMPSPTEECHTGVAEQGGQQAGVGHGAQAADAAVIATCR